MIQTYHEQAAEKGVFIVPSCGFDSVPSDIGSFLAAETLKKVLKLKNIACISFSYQAN